MEFFAENALLADGWARDVVFKVDGSGVISGVTANARLGAAQRLGSVVVPGMANLHSHAFQRAMAGLAEQRGDSADSFWTWRQTMYGFLDRLTPDDVEAIAALVCSEMLEAGFTTLGEFHYLHHDPAGQPYDDPAEMAGRIVAAASAHRHRPDAAAGLLRPWRLRRASARSGSAAVHQRHRQLRPPDGRRRAARLGAIQEPGSALLPIRFAPPQWRKSTRSCRSQAAAQSTSMSPNRLRKSKTALPGAAGVR